MQIAREAAQLAQTNMRLKDEKEQLMQRLLMSQAAARDIGLPGEASAKALARNPSLLQRIGFGSRTSRKGRCGPSGSRV